MHYRDKTFCISENCTCHPDRKYTEKVQLEAEKWWGSDDAPIAVANLCSDIAPPLHELEEIEETMKMLDENDYNDDHPEMYGKD